MKFRSCDILYYQGHHEIHLLMETCFFLWFLSGYHQLQAKKMRLSLMLSPRWRWWCCKHCIHLSMQLWLKASAEPTDHKRPLAFLPLRRLAPAQISLENVSNNLRNTEKKHTSFEQDKRIMVCQTGYLASFYPIYMITTWFWLMHHRLLLNEFDITININIILNKKIKSQEDKLNSIWLFWF